MVTEEGGTASAPLARSTIRRISRVIMPSPLTIKTSGFLPVRDSGANGALT